MKEIFYMGKLWESNKIAAIIISIFSEGVASWGKLRVKLVAFVQKSLKLSQPSLTIDPGIDTSGLPFQNGYWQSQNFVQQLIQRHPGG